MATCTLDDEDFEIFKKFKMQKNPTNSAMIFRCDTKEHKFKIEETIEDISLEKLTEEMSSSSPRYIAYVYRYTHKDGRISFPIVFIYFMPKGISPTIAMTYSANKQNLVNRLDIAKSFDANTLSTLTEDWLKEKLAFFK
ncbi:putative actin binding protein [Cavenderia fasciculata]|uniref:Actin binding protein n=1 Tax=Cavenderia fasciculata TaxID=261658 RepID=F4QDN6_CACFS|nr:putative actin binding protein [Cavenderia fasciculata]EGG13833.1 putative actin binding protein [Cavenderia fasciculata]|eukprot:XP_004350541.1 putative actin binding protein [Cavenderia fasciculata]